MINKLPANIRFVNLFMKLQKEAGVVDVSSLKYAKFDMQDIVHQIDDDKMLEKLIRFYMLYSDHKTFKDFFSNYGSYYDSMLSVIADRALRKSLREQTILKKGDSVGS